MTRRAKPAVIVACPANHYAGPDERIVEFLDQTANAGGLISFRRATRRGRPILQVNLYRLDAGVRVFIERRKP